MVGGLPQKPQSGSPPQNLRHRNFRSKQQMSAKRLPGLHQIWDTHHSRPPNSCPSIITPLKPSIAVQGGSRGLHTRRRRRTVPTQKPPLQGGLWKLTPFEQLPLEKIAQTSEIRNKLAIAKRWTGRRGLFLGNYKNRRDGAFASQENPGVDLENLHDPIIDRIFNPTVSLGGQGTSVGWPCVREARHTRRDFGVGQKFGMDFDLSGVPYTREGKANMGRLICLCRRRGGS